MASNYYKLKKDTPLNDYSSLNTKLIEFESKIFSLKITFDQKNSVIRQCEELLGGLHENVQRLSQRTPTKATQIIDDTFAYAKQHLCGVNSRYKREKIMQASPFYVEPIELASGFKYLTEKSKVNEKIVQNTFQSTFMFVSPYKTLTALFSNEEFENLYFEYNSSHICNSNKYTRFCCGNVYQNSDFFQSNQFAIQLKIFSDDFEPCDALKSKTGKHKLTGFYMQINNLPSKYLSRLSNIYLVALCDAMDSKNEYANTNNAIDIIVNDLKFLEDAGLTTKSGKNLKGTLICTPFDNLGGNILYGFGGSFNSNFFCRFCTASKSECHKMVSENCEAIRTSQLYNEFLKLHEPDDEPSIDWFGIKLYCHLNNLMHFHTMTNHSVDIMHDILEGAAPFVIERLYTYIVEHKIANMDQIQHLIDCFYFGDQFKASIPSKIRIKKKNLGQSASQMYCLLIHIPFILFKFKNQLISIWKPVETLLRILQIVISARISENDVKTLENLVRDHLISIKNIFDEHLRPKHHLLTHYPRVIRAMGPIINFWVMRMEAKHQYFKCIAQETKNFMNLKKTMAIKHQEFIFHNGFTYKDEVSKSSTISLLTFCNDFDLYEEILRTVLCNEVIENAMLYKWIKVNGIKYKSGHLIKFNSMFHQIEHIIMNENDIWFLSRYSYEKREIDIFLNSFILETHEDHRIIKFDDSIHAIFEKKCLNEKNYLIAEDLSLLHDI